MVIEALKHRYYVIHKTEETPKYEIYCCREYIDAQHNTYDVYCVKESLLIQKLILELTDKEKEGNFTDLYECFSKDGKLYLAMVHKEGFPLEKKTRRGRLSSKRENTDRTKPVRTDTTAFHTRLFSLWIMGRWSDSSRSGIIRWFSLSFRRNFIDRKRAKSSDPKRAF